MSKKLNGWEQQAIAWEKWYKENKDSIEAYNRNLVDLKKYLVNREFDAFKKELDKQCSFEEFDPVKAFEQWLKQSSIRRIV